MDHHSFNDWLQLYSKAWTQRRSELINDLFTQDAKYFEKPFSAPFEGIDAIIRYWQGISESQKDISFEYKIISVNNEVGIAHFVASFLRSPGDVHVKLDGIFQVTLSSQNKCTSFSEWWQSQKN